MSNGSHLQLIQMGLNLRECFAHHQMKVRVERTILHTGGVANFYVTPAASVNLTRIKGLSPKIATYLQASDVNVRQTRQGQIFIQVPAPRRKFYKLKLPTNGRGMRVNLGVSCDTGDPLSIDLSANATAHFLIAGSTGSGKTTLMQTVMASLLSQNPPHELRIVVIDPANRISRGFDTSAHLLHPVVRGERGPSRGDELDGVMGRLYQIVLERNAAGGMTLPRIVVFIDEFDAIFNARNSLAAVEEMASRGRAVGVHLVAGVLNPTKEFMGSSLVKTQIGGLRAVGRVESSQVSFLATARPELHAELLLGDGDMILIAPSGPAGRFQAASLSVDDNGAANAAETEVALMALPQQGDSMPTLWTRPVHIARLDDDEGQDAQAEYVTSTADKPEKVIAGLGMSEWKDAMLTAWRTQPVPLMTAVVRAVMQDDQVNVEGYLSRQLSPIWRLQKLVATSELENQACLALDENEQLTDDDLLALLYPTAPRTPKTLERIAELRKGAARDPR